LLTTSLGTSLPGRRCPDLINDSESLLENSFVVLGAALADMPGSLRLARREMPVVAELSDGHAVNQLHDEIGPARSGGGWSVAGGGRESLVFVFSLHPPPSTSPVVPASRTLAIF
jgi:hypothetical protein